MHKCKTCGAKATCFVETGIMPTDVIYYCGRHEPGGIATYPVLSPVANLLSGAVERGELVGVVVNGQKVLNKEEREMQDVIKRLREKQAQMRLSATNKRREASELLTKANRLQIDADKEDNDAKSLDNAIKIIQPVGEAVIKTHDLRSDSGTGSYRIREYSDKTGTCECADYYNRKHACKHLRRLGLAYRAS